MNEIVKAALSPRRLQIASLLVCGMPDREIAELLGMKVATVKSNVRHMCSRFGLPNRVRLAMELLHGTVPRDSRTVTEKGAGIN